MPKDKISAILDFAEKIIAVSDLGQLGNLAVESLKSLLGASRVSLMLLDKENKDLVIWASSDPKQDIKEVKVEFGAMFAGHVAKEGEPLLVKNIDAEFPALAKIKTGRYRSKSFIIYPLKLQNRTIGVINITEREKPGAFSEADNKYVSLVSALLSSQFEKIQLMTQMEDIFIADNLTGLYNHRYFQERLNQEIDRLQRYRYPCSLIILDIDDFRRYNENYGYLFGDRVLSEMAGLIKNILRKVDIVARFGGEEFAVLLPDTNLKQAMIAADKIRDKIASAVFVDKRDSSLGMARITLSGGIAEYNIKDTKEKFIKKAQAALLEAKQKGKNCVCAAK